MQPTEGRTQSRISPGIIQYSFTSLKMMEGWVGLVMRGDRESCWYDLHRELNPGHLHGSTIVTTILQLPCIQHSFKYNKIVSVPHNTPLILKQKYSIPLNKLANLHQRWVSNIYKTLNKTRGLTRSFCYISL